MLQPDVYVVKSIQVFLTNGDVEIHNIAIERLNFGRYIEDILTRIKDGDKDYKSMLPCYYVEKSDEVKECA